MPHDIVESAEQDALATSLLSPRDQEALYREQHPEFEHLAQQLEPADSGIDDGIENALDQPGDEFRETPDDNANELQPLTEEEQTARMESQEVFILRLRGRW